MGNFTGTYKKFNVRGTNVCILSSVDKNVLREMARHGMFEDLVQVGTYDEVLKKKVLRDAKRKAKANEDLDG